MQKKTIRLATLAGFSTLLLAACAHDSGARFGDSVRHMTEYQILDLDAAHNPDPAPVVGGDVYKLDDILEAHRNNGADATEDRGALVTVPIIN
jgi:hypothetical protein